MEGHIRGFLTDTDFVAHLKLPLRVVPEHNVTFRARDNQFLAQTSVHASDFFMMEWPYHVLAHLFSLIGARVDRQELVIPVYVEQGVFCLRAHCHLPNVRSRNVDPLWVVSIFAVKCVHKSVDVVVVILAYELPNFAVFTAKKQSTTVGDRTVDSVALWRVLDTGKELSSHGTNDNVSVRSGHDELYLIHGPAVARIVIRHIAPTRPQLRMHFFEGAHAVFEFHVLIGGGTRYNADLVLHDLSERDLKAARLNRVNH